MPKIINAYADNANASVADSLKSLGDSMFGDQAKQQVYRETAREKGRHNANAEPFAAAARDGDANALAYYGAMAGKTGTDAANYNLLSRSNHASSIDDPRLATAQIGAHEPIASTAIGQGRSLANSRAIASEATNRSAATQTAIADRQIQQQQWADEHTLVNLRGPDGRITMVPKSQVSNLQAHGYDVMPSLDQAKVNLIQPRAPAGMQPGAPGTAPQAPAPLSNDQRAIVGFPHKTPEQMEQEQRLNAPIPPAPSANPAQGAAAQQASDTAGLVPAAQHHANAVIGALPGGPALLQATIGAPQIGAEQENARSEQALRENATREGMIGMPGRSPVFAEKLMQGLFPQGAALANPATESQHVTNIVRQLQQDRAEAAQIASNPNAAPAERQANLAHVHKLDGIIRKWTAPGPTAGAPAQAAPQQQGGDTVIQNGWRYKRDGTPIGPVQ